MVHWRSTATEIAFSLLRQMQRVRQMILETSRPPWSSGSLIPKVDYQNHDISSHPLLIHQVSLGRSSARLGRLPLHSCPRKMKIAVRDSTLVPPSSETPRLGLWLSNLDRAMVIVHVPCVYFYRPNGSNNFFDTKVMKESLGRILVPFYPFAGRLCRREEDGPLEINCNGDGALFVEADAEGEIDDFGDFAPSMELRQLIPEVDYQNQDISSHPLLMVQEEYFIIPVQKSSSILTFPQVTFFKCGGVCLGVAMHHTVVDACGFIHFMNSWSDVAHGMEVSCPPIIERTILRARNPPRPAFEHPVYKPYCAPEPIVPAKDPPEQKPQNSKLCGAIFRFSRDQLARLKEKVKEGDNSTTRYTTFNSLTVHIWRCVSLARGLDDLQPTKLTVSVDGRKRLRPEIPNYYFGNVVYIVDVPLVSGDLKSQPMHCAASKVQDALLRMDDDYLRSALDYLEQQPDVGVVVDRAGLQKRSGLTMASWARLPVYDADFGWGKPIYMGTVVLSVDGLGYILPSPSDDGGLSVQVLLQQNDSGAGAGADSLIERLKFHNDHNKLLKSFMTNTLLRHMDLLKQLSYLVNTTWVQEQVQVLLQQNDSGAGAGADSLIERLKFHNDHNKLLKSFMTNTLLRHMDLLKQLSYLVNTTWVQVLVQQNDLGAAAGAVAVLVQQNDLGAGAGAVSVLVQQQNYQVNRVKRP
ncbi:Shikimate O-hydroxycinnamoyltransferase [Nymphaea thermarum]|nr:Shikimate O-hydroxycinnamoyltransferase [Nymphaea thermarum]